MPPNVERDETFDDFVRLIGGMVVMAIFLLVVIRGPLERCGARLWRLRYRYQRRRRRLW